MQSELNRFDVLPWYGLKGVGVFRLCSVSQEIFVNMTAVKCLVSCPTTLGEVQQGSQVIDKTIDSQKDNA